MAQPTARTILTSPPPDQSPDRPRAMPWTEYADKALSEWYGLLSGNPEEYAVQEFLELHPAMIPGGSGDIGPGGHHGSDFGAVFRRPKLTGAGRTFEPDFLWVTRSSSLITPILIEIEKPSKRWFTKAGRPTQEFTAAHDQLNDWRAWFDLDGNAATFREKFLIAGDRYSDRPLKPQYVLIYGRESEFTHGGGHANPEELRHKRNGLRAEDETIITFDALRPRYDHGRAITLTMTSTGPRLHAFSPVFETNPAIGNAAVRLGDPVPALARSVLMSPERRTYLTERWAYWKAHEQEKAQYPSAIFTHGVGGE